MTMQTEPVPGPKGEKRRGAIAQVILFTVVWSTLVTVFGLIALSPLLFATLRGGAPATEADDGTSVAVTSVALAGALAASDPMTLAVTTATALATILAVWVMRRFFDGPSLLDLGLRRRPGWLRDTLIGLGLGPLMFLAVLLILVAAGWASVEPGAIDGRGLIIAFATFVAVAISEEVFARGWVLQVIERGRGTRTAVLLSSALFAVLHASNPAFGLPALLGLFAAGLLFAQAYLVTRQLWLPIALHLSWNFSEGPIFGFPVSGLPGEGLMTVKMGGPDLVTGGAFGPEAGLIVLAAIGLASAVLALLGRLRPAPPPAMMPSRPR